MSADERKVAEGWVLVVVEGRDRGQMVRLGEQTITIGRGREDMLQLRDPSVTAGQLVVAWDAETRCYWLTQNGDSPTAINGIPATRNARMRHELAEGDQIQIGGTVLRCLRPGSDRGSPPAPLLKERGIAMDFVTALEWKRLGTPGYVLLKAGLVKIEEAAEIYTLRTTDALRALFADLPPDRVTDVLAVLHDYVLAYALDQSGLLDGSSLNMKAVNRLRELGITEPGLGRLRSLIVKIALEVAKDLEQSKKAYR